MGIGSGNGIEKWEVGIAKRGSILANELEKLNGEWEVEAGSWD